VLPPCRWLEPWAWTDLGGLRLDSKGPAESAGLPAASRTVHQARPLARFGRPSGLAVRQVWPSVRSGRTSSRPSATQGPTRRVGPSSACGRQLRRTMLDSPRPSPTGPTSGFCPARHLRRPLACSPSALPDPLGPAGFTPALSLNPLAESCGSNPRRTPNVPSTNRRRPVPAFSADRGLPQAWPRRSFGPGPSPTHAARPSAQAPKRPNAQPGRTLLRLARRLIAGDVPLTLEVTKGESHA
jgi:hypothetical protein